MRGFNNITIVLVSGPVSRGDLRIATAFLVLIRTDFPFLGVNQGPRILL